ncbi:MAG: RNA polymerase sigma-70 factor [Phaeodactylibacter sp.]|nr:RNA polymerase sigma-70 factor [Phaeodactylibacter sp.]MCB9273833.1 RNA polymerase sigma-70 factor [Lewinellaceae bacterium]
MGLDEAGLERLFQQYYTALVAYANGQLRSSEDAREVVQDVFISLWKNRESLDPEGNIRAYLYVSARNRCISHLRRKQLPGAPLELLQHSLADEQHGIEAEIEAAELQAAIYEEVEQLPDKCREIFLLSRREGLSYSQVAEQLGLSVKTVENQIGIALKRIRRRLFERDKPSGGSGLASLLLAAILAAMGGAAVAQLRHVFLFFAIKHPFSLRPWGCRRCTGVLSSDKLFSIAMA